MVLYQSVIAIQSNFDYPDFDDSDFFSRRLGMPSFQTKALVVTSISGDNFRIIPPKYMVG